MPRIGRSFPPQWNTPNIGGADRALGPEPPQIVQGPLFGPSVNLATGILTNQRRAQQRFPRQWYESSETDVGSPRSSIIVYPERALGPDPPTVIDPGPPVVTTLSVNLATGVLTNQRRAQQRRTRVVTPVFTPPPPPVVTTISVTFAVQSRRQTEQKRFPLQGWAGDGRLVTASPVGVGATLYRGGWLARNNTAVFGSTANTQQRAARLLLPWNTSSFSLVVGLSAAGSPTDNVVVSIQGDADGSPDGVTLASFSVSGASIPTTSPKEFAATLSANLVADSRYWIVFSRDGALSDTDNYNAAEPAGLSNTSGTITNPLYISRSFNGTSWTGVGAGSVFYYKLTPLDGPNTGTPLLRRSLGPKPPEYTITVLPVPVSPVQVNLATGVLTNQRRAQQRFPLQGWEGVLAELFSGKPLQAGAAPSSPLLDQFNRAAEDPLSGGGNWANAWTSLAGHLVVTSSQATGITGTGYSYWTSLAFTDCEAYASLQASGPTVGVFARGQPGTNFSGYTVTVGGGTVSILRRDNGSTTNLGDFSQAWSAGDKVGIRCVGTTIEAWYFTGGVWSLLGSATDTRYGTGRIGIIAGVGEPLDDFGGGGITLAVLALVQPLLGVRRPQIIGFAAPLSPVMVNPATGLLTNQRRYEQRRPHSFLFVVQQLAQPPPVVTTITVAAVKTRPRRTTSLYTVALDLFPLAVVTTPGQLVVVAHATRTRPRPVRSSLPLTIAPASAFIAPSVSVTLQDNRLRGFGRRHFPSAALNPPTVLQKFAGSEVTLQAVQTRAQRQRRRLPDSFLSPPATLEPETVALAERQIRVTLARTRPRHTLGTRLGYTVYPATSEIAVTLVRTRPRPTRHALTAITYPQTGVGFIHLVRVRPRPTSKFVAPPATLQPYAVTVAEDTVRVTAVRTRPRPTTRRVNPPTVLQVFTGPAAPLVRTRPRPTQRRLTAISYPATRAIRVVLTRTRPRPTSRTLGPLIFYAQTSEIVATLARIRPRRTVATVRPPAVTSVAQAFYGPSVLLARTRPRRVTSELAAAVFYAATSEITVTAVRTRPRPTRHLLTAITYQQTGVGFQHLVRTRPRPTTRFLLPPATLQPYAVTLAEDTVRVTAVRTRPRHTLGTRLIPPTVLRTFAGPAVTLTHTRPRPTLRRLGPPTVVRVPSVEQREDTITVALVHTRPRPTEKFIVPPLVKTFPPVVTTLLPAHVIKTRPRPTHSILRPPTVVIPLPTLRMQTITVALVHTRPRPTRHSLTPLAFYRQTSKIQVVLARTRPRPTAKRLQPPIFYKQTSEIQVVLTRARPRPTKRILTAVRYEQTTEITVALTRIRPRPTRHLLAPPTVLQTFGPPAEVEIAVRVPLEDRARRRPRSFAIQPVTYAAQSELAVKLTRTRPRPTHSILRPPAVLRAFVAAPVTVTSVRTRPRRTHSFLLPPTAVRTFTAQPILVATVTTRPRPTTARIEPPTRLRPIEATLHVTLARTRPRHVRSNLPSVAVVTEPPTVTTLTVVLTQTRPRPTRSLLAAPATLRRVAVFTAEPIRVTTVTTRPPRTQAEFVGPFRLISVCGWTSGEVVAATDSAGSSILVSGTDGGAVPVAVTESEVAPVAQSEGEDSATGRTEGMDKLAGT